MEAASLAADASTSCYAPDLRSLSPDLMQRIVEHNACAENEVPSFVGSANKQTTAGSGQIEMGASEKTSETLSPAPGREDQQLNDESSPLCDATHSEQRPSPKSEAVLRSSVSSLQGSKGRYHIQRGAAIGKHTNGRVVGRACKLVHLEVAVDAISPNALNSPRILRSPLRKKSPIRWFPRKKTESFLERKIRMLQEKEGTVASLDETLGASNLHLSRIEREKLAAQAAATEAMNARKDALIEASWCRILRLASIPCNSAIVELRKAEKKASEALAAAANLGVILRNGQDSSKNLVDLEPASDAGQTVTASLDTAFDVDKEVTAAIKIALLHVSHERSCDVRNIIEGRSETGNRRFRDGESQEESEIGFGIGCHETNTYTSPAEGDCLQMEVNSNCPIDLSSEAESDLEIEVQSKEKESSDSKKQESSRWHQTKRSLEKSPIPDSLIELMLERIEGLDAEEHVYLAGVVATRGLGALLQEQTLEQEVNEKRLPAGDLDESVNQQMLEAGTLGSDEFPSRASPPKRASDLGSILVKHVPRFQREMQAAKEISILEQIEAGNKSAGCQTQHKPEIESLDKVLVKHVSRLEKERQAAAASCRIQDSSKGFKKSSAVAEEGIPSLAEILKKPPERIKNALLKEAQDGERKMLSELTNNPSSQANSAISEEPTILPSTSNIPNNIQNQNCKNIPDLGSILVKHVSRLEREKQAALRLQGQSYISSKKVQSKQACVPGMDEILVKRMSNLEKEKSDASGKDSSLEVETSLDHIAVHNNIQESSQERIMDDCELDKATGTAHPSMANECGDTESPATSCNQPDLTMQESTVKKPYTSTAAEPKNFTWQKRKSASARQMEEAWGGLDFQNAMQSGPSHDCRQTQLGKPSFKLMVNNETPVSLSSHNDISLHRKKSVRDKKIQEAWGGLSLGNALKRHVSKLELDQTTAFGADM